MQIADDFLKKVKKLEAEEVFPLNELYFAKYKFYEKSAFFSSGGENKVVLETVTYGILQKNSQGVYRDLIRGTNYNINEKNIIECQKFNTDAQLSLKQLVYIFKEIEKEHNLYAVETIYSGSYAEGVSTPFEYRPSEGPAAEEERERAEYKRALEYINWYRKLSFLDKLDEWEKRIPLKK